jgi:hypothetical protein
MGLGKLVAWLVHSLLRLRPLATRGVSRVFMFWKGGPVQYIWMGLIVVGDNFEAFKTFLQTLNPVPFVISLGENLATSLGRIVDALLFLTDGRPEAPVEFFGWSFTLPDVAGVVFLVAAPLVTIGWHYRTIHAMLTVRYGEMIPWHLSFFVGTIILGLIILVAHFAIGAPLPTQDAEALMLSFAENSTG